MNFAEYRGYTVIILYFVMLFFQCMHGDQESLDTLGKGSLIPFNNFQNNIGTNQNCSCVWTRRVYHFFAYTVI